MSLVRARYNQKADVYTQTTTRDPDTREVLREWALSKSVFCQARSIASEGIRTVGSTEVFRKDAYEDEDYIRLRCREQLTKRDRIRNIRNKAVSTGKYTEEDLTQQEEYEVIGVQPSFDPFGRVVEYEVLCYKVQDE